MAFSVSFYLFYINFTYLFSKLILNLLNFPSNYLHQIYPKHFLVVSTLKQFCFPKLSINIISLGLS